MNIDIHTIVLIICRGYDWITSGCEEIQKREKRTTTEISAAEGGPASEDEAAASGFKQCNNTWKGPNNKQNQTSGTNIYFDWNMDILCTNL